MISRTAILLLILSAFGAQPRKTADLTPAANLIRTADLKADLFFLAGSDLAGRRSGTLGDYVATDYIAAQFVRLGLKPVGDNGTYFQNMNLIYGDLDQEHTTLTGKIAGVDHNFVPNKDFRWLRSSLRPATGCGSITFAGYGINAPEYGYNDFAGVDLKGKVAMVLPREPQANDPSSKFMGTWDTYHAFNWEKLELMRKAGVAGLLIVQGSGLNREVKAIPPSSPRAAGGPNIALEGQMWDLPVFTIQSQAADQLLAPSGKTVEMLQREIDRTMQPGSFDVPQSSVCLTKAYTGLEAHPGRNVVGLLEGSDPQLKTQAIVVTAHHDHMGQMNGHTYFGADDNASGTAAVMRIAQAFVEGNVRPKRSILFIVYEGEERIFLGSYYYMTHPLVPLNRTVANFNMDMIGRDEKNPNWPTPPDGNINMVNVLGTRYNPALSRIIADANRSQGLILDHKMDTTDPDSLWSRSDHFWMATLHIPQVEFQTGLHPDYHTDNDTWQRINYDKLTRIARLVFLSVGDLANSGEKVAFLPEGAPAPATQVRMADNKEWTSQNLNVNIKPSWCYENTERNCRQYGRLYTWESARQACQSLGDGWRLPTDGEWRQLAKHYGGVSEDSDDKGKVAYKALFAGGTSGFNALLGGGRSEDGLYARLDAHGFYWTASETDPASGWYYNFGQGGQALHRQSGGEKGRAFSVRCVRE